jgi:hypothetical protein
MKSFYLEELISTADAGAGIMSFPKDEIKNGRADSTH